MKYGAKNGCREFRVRPVTALKLRMFALFRASVDGSLRSLGSIAFVKSTVMFRIVYTVRDHPTYLSIEEHFNDLYIAICDKTQKNKSNSDWYCHPGEMGSVRSCPA
jgi:hypothetical protein